MLPNDKVNVSGDDEEAVCEVNDDLHDQSKFQRKRKMITLYKNYLLPKYTTKLIIHTYLIQTEILTQNNNKLIFRYTK